MWSWIQLQRVLLVIMCVGWGTIMQAAEIHVRPTGDDDNPGSLEKPLASVAGAQCVARTLTAQGPVTVWLHEGVYYLPDTIRFTAEDSGCTYAAAPGETAVLSGGSKLDVKWQPYRDGIMQAPVPPGITIDQLFINGRLQRMARYPNYTEGVQPFGGAAADALSPERVAKWADPTGGYIHSLQRHRWGGLHYRINGKNDKGELTYEGGWQNNRPTPINPKQRYVENIFEELDAPGEWYHNAKTNMLYYYPTPDVDLSTARVEVDRQRHLFEFNRTNARSVSQVALCGLIFRHAARTFMETREPLLRSDWTIYRGGAVLFNGAEDCTLEDCEFDQLGGNAVFVSGGNRRITIRGCDFHDTGASAVAFVGDTRSVRSPRFQYSQTFKYSEIDKTPGPQSDDYPADCLVEDCLIRGVGTVEKQAAGVQISMSMGVTVSHCSIYDTSRAGININEGTFGGHVIEFCDVFDTVLETGDHGSFNSWGRDRYWHLGEAPEEELPALAKLDMVRPNVIRNSRWRCDHGWDVDLDDGSSNYEIYNNVFLHGGLKLREGFHRKVYNNIAVNCTFHPHVWYANSDDEVKHNIWMGAYRSTLMQTPTWGKDVDENLFTTNEADRAKYAENGCDAHSLVGDPMFVDPVQGDFRVKEGSPALKLGFVNFPMDQFGVRSQRLRALARTPELPVLDASVEQPEKNVAITRWRGATLRVLRGAEFSAVGVAADATGLLVPEVDKASPAEKAGLRRGDFIQRVNGQEVRDVKMFLAEVGKVPAGKTITLTLIRDQQPQELVIPNP